MRGFPPIVPYGADQTIYLVVESPGQQGVARQTECADIETVITDLLSGQFNDPIEVVAFNTLEHWTDDLSRDVAREIRCRCDIDGRDVPDYLEEFVDKTSA
ncbi:hypothetical protein [Bradyrhizobium paxllaeri]|uniref:hypothetical protein n=1 Tax=Bradyrhizobium paxllaeri TaxID=190148 RepID=UPI0008107AFA|nr:hypothetical protein [Bradyrhizobium paxllaeri]